MEGRRGLAMSPNAYIRMVWIEGPGSNYRKCPALRFSLVILPFDIPKTSVKIWFMLHYIGFVCFFPLC